MARLDPRAARSLRALARAAVASRTVRVRFVDTEQSVSERTLDVVALAFEPPRWIVATWSRDRQSLRLLDLARIRRVQVTPRRAGPPPSGFDALDFSTRHLLGPDLGPPHELVLRVDGRLARVVPALLPTARVERDSRRGWRYRVRTSRPAVVAAIADSLGACGEIHSASPMPTARRRAKSSSTEARLIGLASWILSQSGPVTRAQIFEAFPDDYGDPKSAGAEKKFSRDKDALRDLGFNLEIQDVSDVKYKTQLGYSIDAHASALPPIELTQEEAAAVWTAAVGALRFSNHPLRDELESAVRKLVVGARGLPPRASAAQDLVVQGETVKQQTLDRLVDAWERRKRIALSYWRPFTGEVVEREVDVYGWARRRGEWIFVGWCHLRKGVRIFYLSRVRALKLNTRDVKNGDYAIPPDFDIRRWSRQEIWDYDVHPPVEATVRLRGSLARIARQLLPSARVSTAEDGARVARLDVRNLRGLVRQALAWGPEAELVAPDEGRAMAREILSAVHASVARRAP
ncbi:MULTISPECIES: YafY family protein [unclassified Anaeromyxobacter]|uniref:helix-turn-helix transcriptional regulator n=1 Tax=unclassified Anaeromyxobacter TaxID=2620896 RepID=UPI001F591B13|nr:MULTISPECIES: WYL domain-containing protein [unclassified Anaeromyxobacter]